MASPTDIDPPPSSWQAELVLAVMVFLGITALGSAIAVAVTSARPRPAWTFLATVGAGTAETVVDILLGFVATMAFAFGVALGGQLGVKDPDARNKVRRTTGAIAQMLMVSSLVLIAGTVVDGVAHPSRLGSLAGTIPLAMTTVALGCHLAGVNVAPFDRQVRSADQALTKRRKQADFLPAHWTRKKRSVSICFLVHIAAYGVLGLLIALTDGASPFSALGVSGATSAAALLVCFYCLAIPAPIFAASSSFARLAIRCFVSVGMILVPAYGWAASVTVAPSVAIQTAILSCLLTILGVAALFPLPSGTPTKLVPWTLNGLAARGARAERLRGLRQASDWKQALEDHQRGSSAQDGTSRLIA